MVKPITLNKITKLSLSVIAAIVVFFALAIAASAESYREVRIDVPRISQRPGTGDCAIASMSTVEAYFHGLPSGNYNSAAYQAVYAANGYSISASWSKIGYKTIEGFDMKTAYNQLKTGYPVIVHRTSAHYSVIYGYDGNESNLEMSGFLVVDVDDSYNSTTAYKRLDKWKGGTSLDRMVVRLNGLAISPSSLKINGNHPAEIHSKGEGYTIYGMAVSNKNITNLTVAVSKADGTVLQIYTATPNETSFALSKANDSIDISKLAVGNYVYSVWAKDASGATKSVKFNFKVASGAVIPPDDNVNVEIKKVSYKAVIKAEPSLNLRMSASIDSSKVTTIPYGEVVNVTAECNGWAMVSYKGLVGWVSMKYIEKYVEPVVIDPTPSVPVTPPVEEIKYARIKQQVTLKSAKFMFSNNVATVSKNSVVRILSIENGWLKVLFNGKEGYVSSSDCIVGIFDVDMNGIVNSADALVLLDASIGRKKLSDSEAVVADANGDGVVNSADALIVLQVSTGEKTY